MKIAVLSSVFRCQTSFEQANVMGGKMNEMLQETGFIKFFDHHYKHVTINDADTVFLPFCFFTDATIRVNNSNRVYTSWSKAYGLMNDPRVALEVRHLQHKGKQCLLVSAHQLLQPTWKTSLRLCRVLLLDKSMAGTTQDIVIPYSVIKTKILKSASRNILVYGAGKNKWFGMFAGMRKYIFDSFARLQRREISMSSHRSYEAYRIGFAESKFCMIIPGDTMSTCMLSRSIMSGCVPIIIANEFRDLPFASILNYSKFSLLVHTREISQHSWIYALLRKVETANYNTYYENVIRIQDYFNYDKFTNTSPYHAALQAIVHDFHQSSLE